MYTIIIFILLLIDVLVKQYLPITINKTIFNNCFIKFKIIKVYNTGVTYSYFNRFNYNYLLILNILAIFMLLYLYIVLHSKYILHIIVAGICNTVDRYMNAAITDYLSVSLYNYRFPIFNITDCIININVLYILYILY
jgi:lipoprotein signal peptidase